MIQFCFEPYSKFGRKSSSPFKSFLNNKFDHHRLMKSKNVKCVRPLHLHDSLVSLPDTVLSSFSLFPPRLPLLSPSLPLYSRHRANLLLPSLVIISLSQGGDSSPPITDFGFIIDWGEENVTVWGSSWFLYEDEAYMAEGLKKISAGKVSVTLQYPKLFGKSFEGILEHVDYKFDLAVIKFKNFDSKHKPEAASLAIPSLPASSGPFLSLDFYSCIKTYLVEPYYFRNEDFRKRQCEDYLHLQLGTQSVQGIILNSEKKILGLKTSRCCNHKDLGHVVTVDIITQCLGPYTWPHRWKDFYEDLYQCPMLPVVEQGIIYMGCDLHSFFRDGGKPLLREFCDKRSEQSKSEDDSELWGFLKVMLEDEGTVRTKFLSYLGFSALDGTVQHEISLDTRAFSLDERIDKTKFAWTTNAIEFLVSNGEYFFHNLQVARADPSISHHGDSYAPECGAVSTEEQELGEQGLATVYFETAAILQNDLDTAKNSSFDESILHILVVGDYKEAVLQCVCANRMADAFVIAHLGGASLFESTCYQFLKRSHSPYLKGLWALVDVDLTCLVNTDPSLSHHGDSFVPECGAVSGEEELEARESNNSSWDESIQHALVFGYYEVAVLQCISANRMADALVLAHFFGGDFFWKSIRDQYLKWGQPAYLKVVYALVNNNLTDLVSTMPLNLWKEIIALLCNSSEGKERTMLCDSFASRLLAVGNTLAATVCYICAGDISKVVKIWSRNLEAESDGSLFERLQDMVEKLVILDLALEKSMGPLRLLVEPDIIWLYFNKILAFLR